MENIFSMYFPTRCDNLSNYIQSRCFTEHRALISIIGFSIKLSLVIVIPRFLVNLRCSGRTLCCSRQAHSRQAPSRQAHSCQSLSSRHCALRASSTISSSLSRNSSQNLWPHPYLLHTTYSPTPLPSS